jgi:hypothetical protein
MNPPFFYVDDPAQSAQSFIERFNRQTLDLSFICKMLEVIASGTPLAEQ